MEYAAIEVGVVGRMKEVVEMTTGEHEGKEGARWGRRRVMVERIDDAVFHSVLKEEERGGHCVAEEEERRLGRAERRDIKDGGMEGISFISTKRRLGRVVGECDSDEPVSGVTLYSTVWLT